MTMHTFMLILGLLNFFAYALQCQQNYVRVQHKIATNDDLRQAYSDMVWGVGEMLSTDCIATFDSPQFDAMSTCWTSLSTGSPYMVCGLRLWRTYKNCDLQSQLNSDFQIYTNEDNIALWQVYSLSPTGDVHCG